MADHNQAKIEIYLSQSEVKMALDMLSIKYNFVVDELAQLILDGEIATGEAAEFLIEEFDFDPEKSLELIDKLSENVIEPFYLDRNEETIEDIEEENIEPIVTQSSKTNWRDFIKPKVLQTGMEELGKASSGDVSRVRNYLWKNLGLNKAEEVIVILSWLARTRELTKLWREDNRFKGILKKYISIKYSDSLTETAMNKFTPALLSLALDMVLVEKLGISKEDSAMISMAIINQMPDDEKPKYILIAYIDSKDNSFNWSKVQELSGNLQLAI
ncbi:hypothetical protein ISR92_03025 [Patescibacteria group bacterium]|nr:hypothetical protein [Patescibacteria group bacterium]